jgi:hypothetical protein
LINKALEAWNIEPVQKVADNMWCILYCSLVLKKCDLSYILKNYRKRKLRKQNYE